MGWAILIIVVLAVVIWAGARRRQARRSAPSSGSSDAARSSSPPSSSADATFSDGWLTINSIGYFGEYVPSPNGRYVLSWSDSDPSGMRGGARKSGKGVYL